MNLEGFTSTSNQCLVGFDLYPYSKSQWLLDDKAPQIILNQNIVILPSLRVPFFTDKHNYMENAHPFNHCHIRKLGERIDQNFYRIKKLIRRSFIRKPLEQKSTEFFDHPESTCIDTKNAKENYENINCKSY
jgi:hypothetical protein